MKQTQLKNKFEIAENSKAKVKFPKIKLKRRRKIYICICMAMCVRKRISVCACAGVHSCCLCCFEHLLQSNLCYFTLKHM